MGRDEAATGRSGTTANQNGTTTTRDGTTFGHVTPETLSLFADLYELRMMQGYLAADRDRTATFSLFFRELPPDRGYAIAAGLEQAVDYVESLTFGERALGYLSELGFDGEFLDYLDAFEFTGDLRALPEGTPVFPNEPLLEVTAPIAQAQLFETLLINQIGFQTLVATKAARMRDAVERRGGDQSLVDFGSRRAHGTDAGLKAARAAYVGGFDGTSNVAAGEAFGLPTYGTMAHSWVQSFATERAAFETFVEQYGEESVLLVDTYDTVAGAALASDVAADLDVDVSGVRLDSGDLVELSKRVDERVDLDVFVSSGMDEYAIAAFLDDGGVATGFGPGTALTTGGDASSLDVVYKLVAVARDGAVAPTMKLSAGKVTHPGAKSVRRIERDGTYERDVLDRRGETDDDLLVAVFEGGERVYDCPSLDELRERTRRELAKLPEDCRALRDPTPYEVQVGDELRATTDRVRERLTRDR